MLYQAELLPDRNPQVRLLGSRREPRRGPSGTIGTNRPDGYEVADQIAAAMPPDSGNERAGAAGLKRLLESRGVMPTDYDDWRRIEETEVANARPGSPREKFVRHQDWLQVLGR